MNHTTLEGIALEMFFAVDHLAGRLVEDRRRVFDEIGDICCLDADRREILYGLALSGAIEEIRDKESYEQSMRVLDYYRKFLGREPWDEATLTVLGHKGRALTKLKDERELYGAVANRERLLTYLSYALRHNEIFPLGTAAVMLLCGIAVGRDETKGLEAARKCARWNDVFGMLMLMKYDNADAPKYLGMLNTLLCFGAPGEKYAPVFARYGQPDGEYRENVELIEKYLTRSSDDRNKFDPAIARIVYSGFVSSRDKSMAVFGDSREYIAAINNLPLSSKDKVRSTGELRKFFVDLRAGEAAETEAVLRAQLVSPRSKPLLLRVKDAYIADKYVKAIEKSFYPAVFVVNAKDITVREAQPTQANFVISALSSAKAASAVFVIKDIDMLPESCIPDIQKLLDKASRSAYRMSDLHVTVDLGGCVFVGIAGGSADPRIEAMFRRTDIAALYKEEREEVVDDYIEECCAAYGAEAEFDDGARKALAALCDLGTEYCRCVVENLCIGRVARCDTSAVCAEEVRDCARNYEGYRFGFKIKGKEDHRE